MTRSCLTARLGLTAHANTSVLTLKNQAKVEFWSYASLPTDSIWHLHLDL
jgi:hypothetical protein